MDIADFVDRALTVPFVPHGRDYTGWDCWGLIYVAHRDVLGVKIPSYADQYDARDVRGAPSLSRLVLTHLPEWNRTTRPAMGDVALFRVAGRPVHVGFMLDPRRMIHSEARIGTMVEPLSSVQWARRLEGVYRHG